MKRQDFYYELPEELIAQDPLEDRSSSRLLVLDKRSGAVSHHVFKEITDYLKAGDCLVVNDTKVIPARLIGSKVGTDAKIEILLLKRKENNVWDPCKARKKGKAWDENQLWGWNPCGRGFGDCRSQSCQRDGRELF